MEAVIAEAAAAPQGSRQANGAAAPAAAPTALATSKTLPHLPKREPVEVKFQDLAYTVSLGFRKGQKEIIRVNGRFCPSQLIAIMGPSGAGKSTLLDILSGYRISGVTGNVMVNGRPRNLDRFRRMSCYIQQDDRLHSLLTVQENMSLAAELKLTRAVPRAEHQAIIDEILNTLGLLDHRGTRTGQLSGGQKKRLSIALELINNPLLMFLDEPTTQAVSFGKQISVLLTRGYIKIKRDQTMTHMRLFVNVIVGLLLGILFWQAGDEGSRVLDNWNLLFTILIHHMMTTMMLTVLTFPTEMQILRKEHFNRWYSLKSYYMSINILELPVSIVCCTVFTVIVYLMSAQPLEWVRFGVFLGISILVVLVAQTVGLLVGALFSVVNGTFLAPTLSVPMMMFAGFGVSLKDMPDYLKWGPYVSYLRYGLEGYVGSIYGRNRTTLGCADQPGKDFSYCHYKYPTKFLKEISMDGEMYVMDLIILGVILLVLRLSVYPLLRWKLFAMR
ncbi:ABC-transporter, subfamily G member 08 [Frankliniella occidentalis]|nr:ABC-transporter, subfamily G member 08 [Frankliniella occidentalis]